MNTQLTEPRPLGPRFSRSGLVPKFGISENFPGNDDATVRDHTLRTSNVLYLHLLQVLAHMSDVPSKYHHIKCSF